MVRPAARRAASLRVATAALALAAAVASSLGPAGAHARESLDAWAAPATIAASQLPSQGQRTYAAILAGGPFQHEKDGAVFGNRERLLPPARRGYYREYTVASPGARHRGARRIVCGGAPGAQPDACYYSSDHYSSFRMILR